MNECIKCISSSKYTCHFESIVNSYYLVKVTKLKKTTKKLTPWATHLLQFPLLSLASLGTTVTTAQTVKDCYRVAVLRKPLDTSSLEQLPYTSVEGPLLVSGLQKFYLWIQGVCLLCFWCTMLGYLLYFLLFLELGEIRGKFSPFNSYSSHSTFYQERILNLLIGVNWVSKYLFLVRLLFGGHKTFKRGVFIVPV